jgi:hypothetical protein
MRVIVISRAMAAALAVLVTVSIAACSANPAPSNAGPGNDQAVTPAATVAAGQNAASAASQPAGSPTATPTGSGGVQNLVITNAERSELTVAFAGYFGVSLSGVVGGGPLPGSVYYAYDPATGNYWALAEFELTGGMTIPIPMMFQMAGTGLWQARRANLSQNGTPLVPACSEIRWFPPVVLMAWSMPTAPPTGVTC